MTSADEIVEQAVNFYLDYGEDVMDDEESRDTKAAIDQALEQGERGEGRPAEQVFEDLRAKYGIPR
jgi:hypothetical protein